MCNQCKLDGMEKAQYPLTQVLGLIWWLPDLGSNQGPAD